MIMNKNVNNKWHADPFFQQATHTRQMSQGQAQLPIKYFDASSLIAFFMVDYDKAVSVLDNPKLKVAKLIGNKALFSLAFYDYRELTDGEPYHEVASSMLVYPADQDTPAHPLVEMTLPPDRRNTGMWICDLPVTTETACRAGKELWGYPKFVTDIDFNLNDKDFSSSVKHPENPQTSILSLSGTIGVSVTAPWADLVLYSMLNDALIRATADTRTLNGAKIATKGNLKLSVDSTNTHPMTQRLNSLDLNGATPFSVTFTDSLQLRLNEGVIFD